MAYDGTAWDEATPTNETIAHELDDIARDIKVGVRSRLAIEHVWPSSQAATSSAGYHAYISLKGRTAAPTLPVVAGTTQAGALWVGTNGALGFVHSSGGNIVLVSSAGTGANTAVAYTASAFILSSAAAPVTAANQGALYSKDSGGQVELYFREESAGDEVQLTKAGAVNVTLPKLGAWSDKSADYGAQLASTDGFVMCYAYNAHYVRGYTDVNADPVTLRAYIRDGGDDAGDSGGTFLMPVKSGDSWKVVKDAGTSFGVFWIPLT